MHEKENEGKAVGPVQTMGSEFPRMPHSPEGLIPGLPKLTSFIWKVTPSLGGS